MNIAEIFPYLTSKQTILCFYSLEKAGFIETCNYNKYRLIELSMTYTLTEKSLELFVNSNLQNVRSIKHNEILYKMLQIQYTKTTKTIIIMNR